MTVTTESIIAPESPKPKVPIKKSTVLVALIFLAVVVIVAAFLADSNPADSAKAPLKTAPDSSASMSNDAAQKATIDEELKRAKEAVAQEEKNQAKLNPPVAATSSPVPPEYRRKDNNAALGEMSADKFGRRVEPPATGRSPNGGSSSARQGDELDLDAQSRSAKSLTFDVSTDNAPSPSERPANGLQRAMAETDVFPGAQPIPAAKPANGTENGIERLLDLARSQLPGLAGASARPTSNTPNGAWLTDYAQNSQAAQRNDAIRPYPTASRYTLHQGKVIPAVLGRQLNSDLPGDITAYTLSDVYDSMGYGALLIPKGSVLVGKYNSDVRPGQERVMFAFQRLIMPDGQSFDLPVATGSDLAGAAGVTGDVNNHFFKMFAASFFTAWLADKVSPTTTSSSAFGSTSQASPAGQVLVDVSKTILDRYRTIPPTITVDQGTRINVEVRKDMEFAGAYVPQRSMR